MILHCTRAHARVIMCEITWTARFNPRERETFITVRRGGRTGKTCDTEEVYREAGELEPLVYAQVQNEWWLDGDATGDEVGKASAAESLLHFSISPLTNLSFAPWEKAGQADYVVNSVCGKVRGIRPLSFFLSFFLSLSFVLPLKNHAARIDRQIIHENYVYHIIRQQLLSWKIF